MRLLLTGLFLALTAGASALEMQYCASDPRLVQYRRATDALYVRPGNAGFRFFCDNPTTNTGNLEPWQDEYCNAGWLALDDEGYDVRLGDSATSDSEYWSRLDGQVGSFTARGLLPLWELNSSFISKWRGDRAIVGELTRRASGYHLNELNAPALIINTPAWGPEGEELREQIRKLTPGAPLGVRITGQNSGTVPRMGWGFVVVDEEVVPESHRGQSCAAWAHREFGQVPVMVCPGRPDFLRDTVWMSSGIAGIFYRPLPERGTADNLAAAIHLRASSTFMSRFSSRVQLMPRPDAPGLTGTLRTEDGSVTWVLPAASGNGIRVQTPSELVGQPVSGNWFNPATDENILQPVTVAPGELLLTAPSPVMWTYTMSHSRRPADTATSVSLIKDWDD